MFTLLAGAGFIAFTLFFMKNKGIKPPTKGNIEKEFYILKEKVKSIGEDLVGFKDDEIALFSYNVIDEKFKKRGAVNAIGKLVSIYHEPMVAYGYYQFFGRKLNAIAIAKTKDNYFQYQFKNDSVFISTPQYLLGEYTGDHILYGAKRNKVIAKLTESRSQYSLTKDSTELAVLNHPEKSDTINQKVFEYLKKNMTDDEKLVVLALSIFEAVKFNIEKNLK